MKYDSILALDLSLKNSGVCYLKNDGTLIYYTFSPNTGRELFQLYEHLYNLIKSNNFKYVVKEGVAGAGPGWCMSRLHQVDGIARLVCQQLNIPLLQIASSSMKKMVTGKGRCSKQEVIDAVSKLYDAYPSDDNQADAIGLYHVAKAYIEECDNLGIEFGSCTVGKLFGTKATKRKIDKQGEMYSSIGRKAAEAWAKRTEQEKKAIIEKGRLTRERNKQLKLVAEKA